MATESPKKPTHAPTVVERPSRVPSHVEGTTTRVLAPKGQKSPTQSQHPGTHVPHSSFDPSDVERLLAHLRVPAAQRLAHESKLGAGGMGSIDIVKDRALARRMARKTIHPLLRSQPHTLRMFLREARVTGLLDHPHIVPVYDIGESENGDLYFTMKLVDGQPLHAIVAALPQGPLDYGTLFNLLEVVIKVCDALAFAHNRGVVHCDVKCENVMVGDFGQVYLMDWGIARIVSAEPDEDAGPRTLPPSDGSTTDESVIGTPSYMSPEQAAGNRATLDARADVFLLGGVLYELLARRPPYVGKSLEETLKLAVDANPRPLSEICAKDSIPHELERIVRKAMAKQRSDRYAGALEVKEDLVRFMRGGAEFEETTFPKGTYIIRESTPGDAAYIIVSGKCQVLKAIDGAASVMQDLGPGQVFGEMAILTEGPRTASILAVEDTRVLVVTRAKFEEELRAMKPWMRSVIQSLASRFRDLYAQKRVTAVGGPNPVRVARQLLAHTAAWGRRDPDGAIAIQFTRVCTEMETQLGIPVAMGILGVISRFPDIALDYAKNEVRIKDPAALAEKLKFES